jgi:hypothetical protein
VAPFYLSEDASSFIQRHGHGLGHAGCIAHVITAMAHKILLTYVSGQSVDTSKEDIHVATMLFDT